MSEEELERIRNTLHQNIDEIINSMLKNRSLAPTKTKAKTKINLDDLPWKKSQHGDYYYLFPNEVPDTLGKDLDGGKKQVESYVYYKTKKGFARRYPANNGNEVRPTIS